VITISGGTGISLKDVTIEAIHPLLEKEIPGFGELFRAVSYEKIGSAAMMTRAIAGVTKGKAVFCLPGSPQSVALALKEFILPEVGHILKHARLNLGQDLPDLIINFQGGIESVLLGYKKIMVANQGRQRIGHPLYW